MWVWISAGAGGGGCDGPHSKCPRGAGVLQGVATYKGLRPAGAGDGCLPSIGSLCLFNSSSSVLSETLAALTAVTSLNCQPQIN